MSEPQFQPGLVLVTVPNHTAAQQMAETLVGERFAACVSLHEIKSVYRWQGAVQCDAEVQLVIKTNVNSFDTLMKRIKELHSYDVPEIVCIPIVRGLPAYLQWMGGQVS